MNLDDMIKSSELVVLQNISKIRSCLVGIERAMANGRILNRLGELQGLGGQLDCSISVLATLENLKREGL